MILTSEINKNKSSIKIAGEVKSLSLLDGWSPIAKSSDAMAIQARKDANARADELLFNSPVASAITRSLRESVVGSGLKLNYAPNKRLYNKLYGANDALYNDVKYIVQDAFDEWAESKLPDYRGQSNLYELTGQAYLDFLSSDCFYSFEYEDGFQVFLLPPSQVQNPGGRVSTTTMRDGIKTTPAGRVLGYFINTDQELKRSGKFVEIDKGDLNHFFRSPKNGASRGVHYLSPAIVMLKLLSDYELSEVKAAQINSALNFILKNTDPEFSISDEDEFERVEVPTGSLFKVPKGHDFSVNAPSRPNPNFNNFAEYVLRAICSVAGAAVESVTLKYESSYTAARGARIEYNKRIHLDRDILELNFLRPIFNRWLENKVMRNEIIIPNFFQARNVWLRSNWMGDANELLDPIKELDASEKKILLKMSSHTEEAAKVTGNNYNDVVEQLKQEKIIAGDVANEQI